MTSKTFLKNPWAMTACLLLIAPCSAFAETAAPASAHTTLWILLKAGGWTMVVLGLLSVFALTMVFYNFLMLKQESLVPTEFTDSLIMKLEAQDLAAARVSCEKKKNIITSITMAGLNRQSRGKTIMRESMEKARDKETTKLWKSIAYLGDVASIAPLLGLLGTVIGMIQAFDVISSAGTDLKPIMLVGGISKALITTAAGLVIAIPTLAFYSYFRGIVQEICDTVDEYSTDIIKLIEETPVLMDPTKVKSPLQSPLQSSASRDSEIQEVLSNA